MRGGVGGLQVIAAFSQSQNKMIKGGLIGAQGFGGGGATQSQMPRQAVAVAIAYNVAERRLQACRSVVGWRHVVPHPHTIHQ